MKLITKLATDAGLSANQKEVEVFATLLAEHMINQLDVVANPSGDEWTRAIRCAQNIVSDTLTERVEVCEPNDDKIVPYDKAGDYCQGRITGVSSNLITQRLGFGPNVKDDPSKVKYSWGFMYKGQRFGIWDYNQSYRYNNFSYYGNKQIIKELFPEYEVS